MSTKATTIEQSKKLLEAGLNPETADMYWHLYDGVDASDPGICQDDYILNILYADDAPAFTEPINIPAWSHSTLWDLVHGVEDIWYEFDTHESSKEVMEALVGAVVKLAKQKRI